MIVTMIGVSCSPFLRKFCDIPRLLKILSMPQICHNEFWLSRGARSEEVTWTSAAFREQRSSKLATAPHVPPVKGGPNSIMRTASEPIEMVN